MMLHVARMSNIKKTKKTPMIALQTPYDLWTYLPQPAAPYDLWTANIIDVSVCLLLCYTIATVFHFIFWHWYVWDEKEKCRVSHWGTEKVCHARKSIFHQWMAVPCHDQYHSMNAFCKNNTNKVRFAVHHFFLGTDGKHRWTSVFSINVL